MSLTSVASTGAATAPSTIDATASEHHTDPAASGFDSSSRARGRTTPTGPTPNAPTPTPTDPTRPRATRRRRPTGSTDVPGDGSQTPKPPVKPATETDPSGQLAALAAPA